MEKKEKEGESVHVISYDKFLEDRIHYNAKEKENIEKQPSSNEIKESDKNQKNGKKETSLRLTVLGFFCGVLSSLMSITGSSAAQVC